MDDKYVFVINGSGGVGKDTFVTLVKLAYKFSVSKHMNFNNFVWNYSSVDLVKRYALYMGWNGVKDEKGRKLLSDLKVMLSEYDDIPFKDMIKKYNEFLQNEEGKLLFLHIREPEEIKRAVLEFNAKTILIKRNDVEHITSNMADANVYDYEYDYVIENNGSINDLDNKAIEFVNLLMEKSK